MNSILNYDHNEKKQNSTSSPVTVCQPAAGANHYYFIKSRPNGSDSVEGQ